MKQLSRDCFRNTNSRVCLKFLYKLFNNIKYVLRCSLLMEISIRPSKKIEFIGFNIQQNKILELKKIEISKVYNTTKNCICQHSKCYKSSTLDNTCVDIILKRKREILSLSWRFHLSFLEEQTQSIYLLMFSLCLYFVLHSLLVLCLMCVCPVAI